MGLAMVAEAPLGEVADGEEAAVVPEPDVGMLAAVVAEPVGPGGAPLYRVAPLGMGLT